MRQFIDAQGNVIKSIDLTNVAYAEDVTTGNDSTSAINAALVRVIGPSDTDVKIIAGTSPDASSDGITLPRSQEVYFWIPKGNKVNVSGGTANIAFIY
jgi:hypothetical protein